jgi:hypothetical protein
VRFLGLELALFGVQLARRVQSASPGLALHVGHVVRARRFGPADMINRDDKSPHCSYGAGDGSDEHSDDCELIEEGPDEMSLNSITRALYGAARLRNNLRQSAARSSRNLGQTYPEQSTVPCFRKAAQVMDTKTQTVAVEMTFDKATKNKYFFAAPTGSAVEPSTSRSSCMPPNRGRSAY